MILTPALCRAARGFLDWTQMDLADRSGVSRSTIRDYEGNRHSLHRATEAQLRLALETGGIAFFRIEGHEIGICPRALAAAVPAPTHAERCEILSAAGERNQAAAPKTAR
ncbi:transcriptional regulator with XRE-family HTH domain [Rhizobium sp. BK347]|uniref:Transcriptional regulator n=1 Tax=Rhizobium tropici TaxID=398 RepID=A0A329Y5R3_RHITR|nr:transcriptional regulator with XRE-family HTH domain [Rhizobium sp. BK252]MBB3400139.1 transcriptional regulator with XRE-family HTH domain [Rhizobium sp. BK289]MBB3412719.1 transcriptional regulator with XRE-family HTH domain [Rhizobium sp. BK284]MBB3480605.1 transcriptional regulator with XRE-family HTH domain [Rhizobium sp. BK347]RAX38707.1 transcriptional regulator [Rhizobium tropici]